MRVEANLSALSETRWKEIVLRFVCGGGITLIASLISRTWGPAVGGLFLAFPAIFPASATLIEKHESERKAKKGLHGKRLARRAAGVDAFGAFLGSMGLVAFAVTAWLLLPKHAAWKAIPLATVAWATTAFLVWTLREHHARWNRLRSSHNVSAGKARVHTWKNHGGRQ